MLSFVSSCCSDKFSNKGNISCLKNKIKPQFYVFSETKKSSNEHICALVAAFLHVMKTFPARGLFSVMLVRYSQLLAAFGTAGSQNTTTVLCCHALAETMFVHAAAIVRLECSFHCLIFVLL